VLLWPDTFNNYFRPETAIAATHVLERLGFTVVTPTRPLCCGRPLYDWGMLDTAKRLWSRTFDTLRAEIEAGVPVIGLEPACLAAFRDELPGLFPNEPLAKRLCEQSVFFSDFLQGCDRFGPPRRMGKALVQLHCHHHAVIGPKAELDLLDRMGVDRVQTCSACCGMAGAFGFEAAKYDVSMKIAERALFPAVRKLSPEDLVLANGFSCREQIEQGTRRNTLHVAELVADAMGLTQPGSR
jgi:Fe-S oxidoreductase